MSSKHLRLVIAREIRNPGRQIEFLLLNQDGDMSFGGTRRNAGSKPGSITR